MQTKNFNQPALNKSHPKFVRLPAPSRNLAEFFGIMMGDGSITPQQIIITLHAKDDLEYAHFVSDIITKLFKSPPSLRFRNNSNVVILRLSRIALVKYLEQWGLKKGNKIKQNMDVPEWIKANESYRVSCLRGLVDTDGCIFEHSYKVRGKLYRYTKFCFTSYSLPLRHSVFEMLRQLGFNPRMSQNRDVRLDSQADVKRYFQLVKSHNPKHLKKMSK
jgi:intein/homing endonuclease